MQAQVLGIDVAKVTLDVVLSDGQRGQHAQFPNSPGGHAQLANWLQIRSSLQAQVCLEATGQYGDRVAEYLFRLGFPVSVVNPARIKHYACSKLRRNKTDKADAALIAEYCLRERPALWSPPPASFKHLQALVRHLDGLQVTRQQQVNRLASGVQTLPVLASLHRLLGVLDEEIRLTKQAMQEQIDQQPDLKRMQALLVTIPGIGLLTAAKLLGEIRQVTEFDSARQLAAYAGLTPRNVLSGISVHKKARLSKTGNAHLRKILYLPAIVAKRYNPIVQAFCERLTQSGLRPMEVIAAAMRKLLHLIFGILKSGRPFDPLYLLQAHPGA